jgi:MFS family permease
MSVESNLGSSLAARALVLADRLLPKGGALRHRNYRLFFAGQGLSLIGTWTQRTALPYVVYEITGSKMLLGLVGFTGLVTFFVAPFAGVIADKVNRRRLLIATQILAMIQAFILAGLYAMDWLTVWEIVALSAMLNLINGFDIPIRQSFVVEMLESRDDLPNAIVLNSFLVNGGKLIGPMVAGGILAILGAGLCFLINGVTFIAVIAALMAMRLKPAHRGAGGKRVLQHLREGAAYAVNFAPIRAILLLLSAVSLLGMSYGTLLPVFAKDVLKGGPDTLGWLMSATGVGAIGGALFLGLRRKVRGLGRVTALASLIFGASLTAFACSKNLWLSLTVLAAAGFGQMVQFSSSNALIQTLVDDDKRGRVMSFYVMSFMGMGPFGALLAGWLANQWDASTAVIVGGVGSMLAAVVFATQLPKLGQIAHPVYARLGIVAQVAVDSNGQPAPTVIPSDARL